MHSRAILVLLAAAFLLLTGLSGSALAQQGTVFRPSDQTPPKGKNPCAKNIVPDDVYDSFKDLLGQVLGTAGGVPADIDSQVKGKVPPGSQSPVDVEVFVVDLTEFQKEYSDDVDSLFPGKTPAELNAEATNLFNQNSAYTYVSDKKNAAGNQKIKVKVFCKESFRTATIDKSTMRELLVHELVHAKLYTMLILGVAEASLPFRDHDEDPGTDNTPGSQGGDKEFYDEVRRLFNLLKSNLKLSYAPGSTFSSPLSATLVRFNPLTGAVIARIALSGTATVTMGSGDDWDNDGRFDVPIHITALTLSGGGASVGLNPFHPSIGLIEQPSGGPPFPASSGLILNYVVHGPENTSVHSGLLATVSAWPPFDQPYQNFHPSRPIDLERLTFGSTDLDRDGRPDQLDPDDDNDGTPDVEDPDPRHPSHT